MTVPLTYWYCLYLLIQSLLQIPVFSWPGMSRHSHNNPTASLSYEQEYIVSHSELHHQSNFPWLPNNSTIIGPHCTVGAHNNFTQFGPCPDTPQPTSEHNYDAPKHTFASQFMMDWIMYFVPNGSDTPPYDNIPNTPYNFTYGKTYYDINYQNQGITVMREQYKERCIPVFANGSMSGWNDYSCDFINIPIPTRFLNNNNNKDDTISPHIAYVVLHEDRPIGAPECCIIGYPFHPPPQDFANGLSVKFQNIVNNTLVDWNAVWLTGAGVFSYGFRNDSPQKYGIPFGFYMHGLPPSANWCYQRFDNFTLNKPSDDTWDVPDSCKLATACPGWG